MARGIDLTNQRFGKLVALKLSNERTTAKLRIWECRCDCGKIKKVVAKSLRNGMTKSCGCEAHPSKSKNVNWKGYGEISLDFYTTLRRNAQSRFLSFEVSIEYLWELFLKQDRRCALSGRLLQFGRINKDRANTTVSIDRINSSKGYVEGNVQWVHKKINIMKNVYSQEEFLNLCKEVVKHNKNL